MAMIRQGWHADIPETGYRSRTPRLLCCNMRWRIGRYGEPEGHLISDSVYSNYRLSLDYRFTKKQVIAGVLVHVSRPRMLYKMFPQSIEAQLHTDDAGDFGALVKTLLYPIWRRDADLRQNGVPLKEKAPHHQPDRWI